VRPAGDQLADDRGGERVDAFLRQRLGGQVTNLERINHGEWSTAFSFTHRSGQYVVRFSARDEDFLKDQRVMRYRSSVLPVPNIIDIGPAFDGFYALSQQISGRFFDTLDGAQLHHALPSLFDALDAMRTADITDSNGFGIWDGSGNAPHATWHAVLLDVATDRATNRTHGWRERLLSQSDAAEAFEVAYAALRRSLTDVPRDARYLVHSDLLNFNVLVDHDVLSGVIDWGSALYGDFVWDIAWLTFWQPWYPAWRGIDITSAAQAHYAAIGLDVPNFAARVRCCELAIGLDGMAYQAFKQRWSDLEATGKRVLAIVRR
jgi:hygromycin-B 4-O-kinase